MKTPRVILKGLVSGRVKLTPELLEVLKKHRDEAPQAKPQTILPAGLSPARRRRQRMIFASPLPGRWIRCSGPLMVCACLLLPLLARAAGTDATFDEANRAFAAGNMSAAARAYQSVIASQGFSASTLFNLANAQLRDGHAGPAILNYERAHWLAPNDPDIVANLDFARHKANLPAEAPSRIQAVFGVFSLNGWSTLAATGILMLAAMPLFKRLVPAQRVAFSTCGIVAALILLAGMGGVASRWGQLNRAIITAPETAARVSPVTVIPPLFRLHAGETVTLKKLHGKFALIVNAQGHEGWVSSDAVSPIVASAS